MRQVHGDSLPCGQKAQPLLMEETVVEYERSFSGSEKHVIIVTRTAEIRLVLLDESRVDGQVGWAGILVYWDTKRKPA